MNHARILDSDHPFNNLAEHCSRLNFGQRTTVDLPYFVEVAAVTELHCQIKVFAGLRGVVQSYYVL